MEAHCHLPGTISLALPFILAVPIILGSCYTLKEPYFTPLYNMFSFTQLANSTLEIRTDLSLWLVPTLVTRL